MARRPSLTASGLLSESFGERPYTVRLREEKAPGTNVVLDYTLFSGDRKKPSLGYPVRKSVGRRWEWDEKALEKAREEAQDRSAQLRLTRMREEVLEADALTFGEAVAMYQDEATGGFPRGKTTRGDYRRILRNWTRWFGAERAWNRIRRSEVLAWARKREAEGKIPSLLNEVAVLRILHRWLDNQAGIEGLMDPVKRFPWKTYREAHRAFRPRYTQDEIGAMVKVRHDVDPRFALFLALMADSGARRKAILTLTRSALDRAVEGPPDEDQAPYGWVEFPALKGQLPPLHLLTAFQRREIELALSGYLRHLEERWETEGLDYPLFPGGQLLEGEAGLVIEVNQPRAYTSIGEKTTQRWLVAAEKMAGVEHIEGKGYHGIRRAVSDFLYEELGLDGLTTAMGWSSRDTPEKIYIDRRRMRDRNRAREAMEKKRRDQSPDPGEE